MTVIKLIIIGLAAVLPALAEAGFSDPVSADKRPRPATAPSAAAAGKSVNIGEIGEWGRLSRPDDLSAARRPRSRSPEDSLTSPPETEPEPILPREQAGAIEPETAPPPGPTAVAPPPLPPSGRYGRLPPHFIRNDGQIDPVVLYYMKGPRGTVYLTGQEVVFDFFSSRPEAPKEAFPPGADDQEPEAAESFASRLVFRLRFLNAGPETAVEGGKELPGKINYFVGDRENWRTAIPTFEEVVYRDLYPGVDLACLFAEGNLVYRVTVAPGADPGSIRFQYSGLEGLEINPAGDLIVLTAFGGFRTPAPRLHQEIEGEMVKREGAFVIREDSSVGLEIGPYDREFPLVIEM